MAKKIQAQINLQIKAGQANPAPPIGPALGQQGVNIMKFCEAFNAHTKDIEAGMPTPVEITVYSDRSFTFVTKPPPAAYLILRAIGVSKGSSTPNKTKIGRITRGQLAQIATLKMPGLTASNLDAAIRTIAGTARNMGVEVEGV